MFDFFNDITFANKELLWLLLGIPLIATWYILRNKSFNAELKVSSIKGFEGIGRSLKIYLRHSLIVLRVFSIALLIVVLARPLFIKMLSIRTQFPALSSPVYRTGCILARKPVMIHSDFVIQLPERLSTLLQLIA